MSCSSDPIAESEHAVYNTGPYNVAGAAMMSFQPLSQIHQHLCALHIYAQDPQRAVRAHHFCTHLRPDLHQCVIYDSDQPGARLVGVEYVVPEEVFLNLPEDEKKYWHSHKYEVESGMLILGTKQLVPNLVSDIAERPAMLELHKTYGKTIHTWEFDRYPDLPLGPPHSMMSYTADGQMSKQAEEILDERDRSMGVSTQSKRQARAGYLPQDAKDRSVAEGCDVWQEGRKGRWVWIEDESASS